MPVGASKTVSSAGEGEQMGVQGYGKACVPILMP